MARTLTNSEVIAELLEDVKKIVTDEVITNRYALQKLYNKAGALINRFGNNRQLHTQNDIMTVIEALQMEQVSHVSLNLPIPLHSNIVLKRSVEQLPDFFNTKFGPALQLLPFDYLQSEWSFNLIEPKLYSNQLKRKYVDKRIKFWWVLDDRLYIVDYPSDYVRLQGLFKYPCHAKALDKYCDAPTDCFDLLEEPFVCPDFLYADVLQLAATDFYKREQVITEDVKDMNNSNRQTARPI